MATTQNVTAKKKTVTTAGTSVALDAVPGLFIKIKALVANGGNIYVKPGGTAGTDYRASVGDDAGYELDAGQETEWIPLSTGLASHIVIDTDNGTDGVTYLVSKVNGDWK